MFLAFKYDWSLWARPEQLRPEGPWDVLIRLAGRAGGKTRPGSHDVIDWSHEVPLIALMAKDAAQVRDVLIEGESGILACSPPWWKPKYDRTKLRLTWQNGAQALSMTAEAGADAARGRQFYKARAEEVVTWPHVEEAWNEGLLNAVRLGTAPQVSVTSTPKRSVSFFADLCLGPKDSAGARPVTADKIVQHDGYRSWAYEIPTKDGRAHRTEVRQWSSDRNAGNLAPGFVEKRRRQYGLSQVGAEELDAELLDKVEGALFLQSIIEAFRVPGISAPLPIVAVALDPTRSDTPVDECGIVVGGSSAEAHAFVYEDLSMRGSPDQWIRVAIDAYHRNRADVLVYEKNRMGTMVRDLVRSRDPRVRLVEVNATEGKRTRAEPVSALYERGRVHHVGTLSMLEDEMTSWDPASHISPNRMDALVWLVTYLLLGEQRTPLRLV